MSTLAFVATDGAHDVDYSVACGECAESAGEPRTARYVVTYDSADLDGEPTGERLFSCKECLGDAVEWAHRFNRSFVPPSISRIPTPAVPVSVPRCVHCSAAYYECVTDFRGLCAAREVSA